MTMWKIILIYLCTANAAAFILYGMDKKKAEAHQWRIPESTLIMMSVIGGGIGSICGMYLFHHKTKHLKFRVFVPFFTILWCVGLAYLYMQYR